MKIFHRINGMEFVRAEIDEELQMAGLLYNCNGVNIHYYISSCHTDNSWGIDVEDEIISEYYVDHREKGEIKIIEFQTLDNRERSYASSFEHNGLEYFLIGAMKKGDFEEIVKNLIFF